VDQSLREREEGPLTRAVRRAYDRLVIPTVSDSLVRQRIKLLWFGWAYWRLLGLSPLTIGGRVNLIRELLAVDWNVLHGHSPGEIVVIFQEICFRPVVAGEHFVEAGCWQGGSTAKFSILCDYLGIELHVYDSFEGVGDLSDADRAKEWDYEGQYAAPEQVLRDNLDLYGRPSVCRIYKGWFSATLKQGRAPGAIRVAYIDCDIAKGTRDALEGIVPRLAPDGVIFSQDFHIKPIRDLLGDPSLWQSLEIDTPEITALGRRIARIKLR
jgi:O-methyltransferase